MGFKYCRRSIRTRLKSIKQFKLLNYGIKNYKQVSKTRSSMKMAI